MAAVISHPSTIRSQYQVKDEKFLHELTYSTVSKKAFEIATYYIPYHLRHTVDHEKLRGLPKIYLIPPSQPSELNLSVTIHCTRMKSQYTKFFEDVPLSLSLNESNAEILFIQICGQIFADGTKNWGRVITIFALAGTFAAHFANQELLNVIINIPKWVQKFFDQVLVDWITEQGGWVSASKFVFLIKYLIFLKFFLIIDINVATVILFYDNSLFQK